MKFRLSFYICMIVLFLLTGIFFSSCTQPNEEPEQVTGFTITVQYEDSEQNYVAFDGTTLSYTPFEVTMGKKGYDGVLRIDAGNSGITDAEFWIEKDGAIVDKLSLTFEENQCILPLLDYGSGRLEYALVLKNDYQTTYYVSTGATFLEATKSEQITNQTICQLTDITVDEAVDTILLSYPFVWNTNGKEFFTKAQLDFSSTLEGKMIIQNRSGNIVCESVSCDTPLWKYELETLFGEFTEEKYFSINAKSINGRTIDTTTLFIDTMEKLNSILKEGILCPEAQVETIEFAGDMALEGVRVTTPVSLRFIGNIVVADNIVIAIADNQENTVTIDTTQNHTDLAAQILLEAPNTHVVWNGAEAPNFDVIQQYQNVKSYNGQACNEHLGGTGATRLLSGTICDKKDSNKNASLEIDGNYVSVKMGYMNTIDLSNAKISAKLDGDGVATIKEEDGTYYCVVTDAQQKERGYQIRVTNKDYTLPVIYITTEGGKAVTSTETYVNGSFSIDYKEKGTYLKIENAAMQIRGRGHSSWELAKKPYKIKFEEKVPLFGLTAAKEWVLQANHIDRSLMRNNLAMSMGSLLTNMVFVPHSYLVDVFVNGAYQGVYSLTEQVEMKDGRIPGEKDSTEVNCDYLVEFGGEMEDTSFGPNIFSTTLCQYVEIKTPDSDVLSAAQYQYIKDYFQKLDDAFMQQTGYEEYIDVPSLIDWFILHEFSYNTDCTLRRSNFFLKKKDGKLYVAAPWDFDYAFGNMSLDSNNYQEWICLGNAKTDSYDHYIRTNWMEYLLKDANFQKQLKARWAEVGESLYQKALATIDANEKQIGLSATENFTRWNQCLGVKLQYESKKTLALDTYAEQVDYLRTFLKNRYEWMDNAIDGM